MKRYGSNEGWKKPGAGVHVPTYRSVSSNAPLVIPTFAILTINKTLNYRDCDSNTFFSSKYGGHAATLLVYFVVPEYTNDLGQQFTATFFY